MGNIGLSRRRAEEDSRGEYTLIEDGRDEVVEQLLPGILNDITLHETAPKLPWTTCDMLSAVSSGWQQVAVHCRQVYDAGVHNPSTQTLVLLNYNHVKNDGMITLFSLRDESMYHLPPIPGLKQGLPHSCECIFLDGKLYVLGGYEEYTVVDVEGRCYGDIASAKVYMLDLVAGLQWKQCPSMVEPRAQFGCGVINGKIYVFGGTSFCVEPIYCGSEVYDPKSNTWSPIASSKYLGLYPTVVTIGEEFFVHDGLLDADLAVWRHNSGTLSKTSKPTEVYNPLNNQWRTFHHLFLFGTVFLTMGGKLHKVERFGTDLYDVCTNSWKTSKSFSFGALEDGESIKAIKLSDIIEVDNELFGIGSWRTLNAGHQICLIRGRELGSQSQEIEWQKVECPLSSCNVDFRISCSIKF